MKGGMRTGQSDAKAGLEMASKFSYHFHNGVYLMYCLGQAFFSPVLQHQEQQNFRNFEFRREILEFNKISFHFDGRNLEFPLSFEEKSCIWAKKP